MIKSLTKLDLNRSILWEYADPKNESICQGLMELIIWYTDGKICEVSDEETIHMLESLINNFNRTKSFANAIKSAIIVKRDRVDDLIY